MSCDRNGCTGRIVESYDRYVCNVCGCPEEIKDTSEMTVISCGLHIFGIHNLTKYGKMGLTMKVMNQKYPFIQKRNVLKAYKDYMEIYNTEWENDMKIYKNNYKNNVVKYDPRYCHGKLLFENTTLTVAMEKYHELQNILEQKGRVYAKKTMKAGVKRAHMVHCLFITCIEEGRYISIKELKEMFPTTYQDSKVIDSIKKYYRNKIMNKNDISYDYPTDLEIHKLLIQRVLEKYNLSCNSNINEILTTYEYIKSNVSKSETKTIIYTAIYTFLKEIKLKKNVMKLKFAFTYDINFSTVKLLYNTVKKLDFVIED